MNKLVDFFGGSVERLGAFYPTHCLMAIFRNPSDAEFALHRLLSAGFSPVGRHLRRWQGGIGIRQG